jgi:hypothetical protein
MMLVEGVFFVPFFISLTTCCAMIPALRRPVDHSPSSSYEARNYRAIWSICRITLFTVACYAPQFLWAAIDKVCVLRCGENDGPNFCW